MIMLMASDVSFLSVVGGEGNMGHRFLKISVFDIQKTSFLFANVKYDG